MKASMLKLTHVGLAVLLIGVLGNGYLHADYSGGSPSSFGLNRLQRDLAETRLTRGRAKIVQNVTTGKI